MNNAKTSWEKYAEKYLEKRGYKVVLIKQYQSKTVYQVSKKFDKPIGGKTGLSERIEIPYAVTDKAKYMSMIEESLNIKLKMLEFINNYH